jgi:hypothetical protein
MSDDTIKPVAYIQSDHLDVLRRSGMKHLVRMSANQDDPCLTALYTEQALFAARQQALDHVMTRIPSNLPHDDPYRPVNLGWSQCCEYMRGAVDDLRHVDLEWSYDKIMSEIESMKDTDKEHP